MTVFLTYDNEGKLIDVQRAQSLPPNFESPEWLAYERAFDAAEPGQWTPEMASTFAAYQEAQKRGFKSDD